MKVRNIGIGEDGYPETITVELTVREAVYLSKLNGRMSCTDVETAVPGFSAESRQIYSGLAGDVFNRYFEDGVDEALRYLS